MEYTRESLQAFIDNRIEESSALEFKAAAALGRANKNKENVTKDVAAFANSAGGAIVYGIKCFDAEPMKHLPEKLDPVDRTEFSKEWLEQIISQIAPKIEGVHIRPVHVGPREEDFCYVVEVPQSGKAHQALDYRYYRRWNFEATPMEDYEIRDVMNRRHHPKLSARLKIRRNIIRRKGVVLIWLTNESAVLARHYSAVLDFPLSVDGQAVTFKNSFINELEDGSALRFRLSGPPLYPLFPGDERRLDAPFNIFTTGHHLLDGKPIPSIKEIRIMVFADAMPALSLSLNVNDALLPVETTLDEE